MRGSNPWVIRHGPLAVCCLLATLLVTVSCQQLPPELEVRSLLTRGEDQLVHDDYHGAIATFQTAATSTDDPNVRASALLGVGRGYMALGYLKEAKEFFTRARATHVDGALADGLSLALGELYFEQRDYYRALRSLRPAVEKTSGPDRERLLVMAGVSAHRNLEHALGDRYMRQVDLHARRDLEALVLAHIPDYHARVSAGWHDRPVASAPPKTSTPPSGSKGTPTILPRRSWHASSIRWNRTPMRGLTRITVHHSAMVEPSSQSFSQAASVIKRIQGVHQKQRGWADIGYHYIIDRSGRVWEGRSLKYQGAHARGSRNRGNIGVVLLGNFTRQHVTQAQSRGLYRLLGYLCARYHVSRSRVYTHSEILNGQTQCPGAEVAHLVRRFRREGLALAERKLDRGVRR